MNYLLKDWKWLEAQAKTLETQTRKKYGRSLTFSGICDRLLRGVDRNNNAAVTIIDGGIIILEKEKYKANKKATVEWLEKSFTNGVTQVMEVKNENKIRRMG